MCHPLSDRCARRVLMPPVVFKYPNDRKCLSELVLCVAVDRKRPGITAQCSFAPTALLKLLVEVACPTAPLYNLPQEQPRNWLVVVAAPLQTLRKAMLAGCAATVGQGRNRTNRRSQPPNKVLTQHSHRYRVPFASA